MDEEFIKYVKETIINFDTVNFDVSLIPGQLTKETCKALLDVTYKTVKSSRSNEDQKTKAIKIFKTVIIKTKSTVLINLFLTCQMWGFFCGQYRTFIQSGKKPTSMIYTEKYFDILEYLLEQLNYELGIDNNNNETPFAKFWKACHTKDFQKNEFLSILTLQIAGLSAEDPDSLGLVRFSLKDYENNPNCSYFIREFIKKYETKSKLLDGVKNNPRPDQALFHEFKTEYYKFIEKEYFFGYLKDEPYDLLKKIIDLEEMKERLKVEAHSLILNTDEVRKEVMIDREDSMNSIKQIEQKLVQNMSEVRQTKVPAMNSQIRERSMMEDRLSPHSQPRTPINDASILRKSSPTPKINISPPREPLPLNAQKKNQPEFVEINLEPIPSKKYKVKAFDSVILPEDRLNNNEESLKRRSKAYSQRDPNSAIDINLPVSESSLPKPNYKIFDRIPLSDRKPKNQEPNISRDEIKMKDISKLSVQSVPKPIQPPGRLLELSEKRIQAQNQLQPQDLKRLKAFAIMDKQKIFSNNVIKLGIETFLLRFNDRKEVKVKCFWDPIFGTLKNTIVNIRDSQGRPIPAKVIDNSVEFGLGDFPRSNNFPWIELSYTAGDQMQKTKVELLLPFRKFMKIPKQSQIVAIEFSKPEYNTLVTEVYPLDADFFREAKHIHLIFNNFTLVDQNTLIGIFEMQSVPDLFFIRFNVVEGSNFYCELKYKSNHLERFAEEILQEIVMLIGDFNPPDN